ncbi:methyl-accepting chemotaxis protein [Thiocystis minor]|uniref:methyl-accepting chemotaxis protein n=1 Tax=Thiocystis minor TaxID=61597 RepID=UPI0023EE33B9|nr:methyl-accepting chemotaxis protein [Thiocystis minor]
MLKQNHLDLSVKYGEALKQFDAQDPNAGKLVDKLIKGIDRPASEGMEKLVGVIEARFSQRITDETESIGAIAEEARFQFLIFVVFGLLASSLLSFLVLRDLLRQLGGEPSYAAHIAHQIANDQLDLEIKESVSAKGSVLAAMKTMQQALKTRLEIDRATAAENLRVRIALDCVDNNIRIAGADGKVVFANRSLLATLKKNEAGIARQIPGFSVDGFIGSNIGAFYSDPQAALQRLAAIKDTTRTRLVIGDRDYDIITNPVIDNDGQRLGTVGEWADRTEELAAQKELNTVVDAAVAGDFARRLGLHDKQGFFLDVAEKMNALLEIVSSGLADVGRVLNAISRGDLTERIESDYAGVFGRLKDDTNATVARLHEVIGSILDASEAIGSAASEIAAGNADLSRRTEEQAASLEETASSMEQLNATVRQNAQNATQANQLAQTANAVTTRGGEMVHQVVGTMGAIQDSSKKIADIISVIDGIAFQTNILALNAAVEAARAGEQGRGFAVVAAEVRNLAGRSAQAAKEIKGLITDSVAKVENGAQLAGQAGDTMDEIVSGFRQVVTLVDEITHASREQSTGIEQVTQAVAQMDEVTQQNAALVEEAAAAAESLEDQTRALSQAVAMFRLETESARPLHRRGREDGEPRSLAVPLPSSDAPSGRGEATGGDCESLAACPFFNGKMKGNVATVAMMKQRYCRGDKTACARYAVSKALGKEKVPTDLYPNQSARAKSLIAVGSSGRASLTRDGMTPSIQGKPVRAINPILKVGSQVGDDDQWEEF